MVTLIRIRPVALAGSALLLAVMAMGCSSLHRADSNPLVDDSAVATVSDPMVVVELRDGDDSREYLRAPLQESMLVQDALKGAGATSRFRRMDVVLVRQAPNGEKLRLPVRYDASQKQVVNENNYALMGGDWLEVTEDTSNTLDRMVEKAFEPLRPMMRTYLD